MQQKITLQSFRHRRLLLAVITLIFLVGFVIRIYQLTAVPYGFHADEAAIGYNAYTLLTKGTDEYGVAFPAFFKSFGEYKSPVQIYSTVPAIAVLGLNEFSTRLISVIYAMLSLLAIYLLTTELFKTDKHAQLIALFALFFLVISPWHIQFSRVAYELMPFVFFTTMGLFFFLKTQNYPKILPVALVSFCLALYSYFTGRIFIPILGIGLLLFYFKFFLTHKKVTLISFIFLLILLIPFIQSLFSQVSLIRWEQSSVFYHPSQNEPILQNIAVNYLNHFSLDFLFLKGDVGMPGNYILRDSIKGMGELYLFQLPLLLTGAYALMRRKNKSKDNAFIILLLLVLLYPLGGMFASDGSPFARRSIIGVIPFQILSALGSVFLLEILLKAKKVYKITLITLGIVIVTVSFGYYLRLYFIVYPTYSSAWWGWQYGPKDIVSYFVTHKNDYDDLVMSPYFNGRYEFFKFYAPNDCAKCKVGLPDDFFISGRKQLYALPSGYTINNSKFSYFPRKILYYPDGSQAFIITEVKVR